MPLVTFSDCAQCPVLRHCSAHFPAGEWEHDKGVDPCVVVDESPRDYVIIHPMTPEEHEDHDFEVHCMQMAALGDERYI